jgi:hypothetical protein
MNMVMVMFCDGDGSDICSNAAIPRQQPHSQSGHGQTQQASLCAHLNLLS